jgi:hypothetical protein
VIRHLIMQLLLLLLHCGSHHPYVVDQQAVLKRPQDAVTFAGRPHAVAAGCVHGW